MTSRGHRIYGLGHHERDFPRRLLCRHSGGRNQVTMDIDLRRTRSVQVREASILSFRRRKLKRRFAPRYYPRSRSPANSRQESPGLILPINARRGRHLGWLCRAACGHAAAPPRSAMTRGAQRSPCRRPPAGASIPKSRDRWPWHPEIHKRSNLTPCRPEGRQVWPLEDAGDVCCQTPPPCRRCW